MSHKAYCATQNTVDKRCIMDFTTLRFFTTYPGVLYLVPFIIMLLLAFAGAIISDD